MMLRALLCAFALAACASAATVHQSNAFCDDDENVAWAIAHSHLTQHAGGYMSWGVDNATGCEAACAALDGCNYFAPSATQQRCELATVCNFTAADASYTLYEMDAPPVDPFAHWIQHPAGRMHHEPERQMNASQVCMPAEYAAVLLSSPDYTPGPRPLSFDRADGRWFFK